MFDDNAMDIIRWAAQECERQHSGEMSVYYMVDAWDFLACKEIIHVTPSRILLVGRFVDPKINEKGFRKTPVTFSNGNCGLDPTLIERQIELLCEAANKGFITPDEFYRMFEEVHPFSDGNGRVGSLLWNYLRGTINEPAVPPNFFLKSWYNEFTKGKGRKNKWTST